eukprot:jgi/Mesvir1/14013/Mv21629-RA.1
MCSEFSGPKSADQPFPEASPAMREASGVPGIEDVLQMLRDKRAKEFPGQENSPMANGEVYLVGTGPGDPELLTLKALRLMQTADLVLYDRLVSNEILDLIRGEARLVYVGKASGYHTRSQGEIHELMALFAGAGAKVLRLKGGDPLVFGRGGEEMEYLMERGIKVHIVPGITSAAGIGAGLGIPLTHRGIANSVRFMTGHAREGSEEILEDVHADPRTTLVVYMGLRTLPLLASSLTQQGLPPTTPAAAIEKGTTPDERVVFATLEDLPDKVEAAGLASPTLLLIGDAVAVSPFWAKGVDSARARPVMLLEEREEIERAQRQAVADAVVASSPGVVDTKAGGVVGYAAGVGSMTRGEPTFVAGGGQEGGERLAGVPDGSKGSDRWAWLFEGFKSRWNWLVLQDERGRARR